MATPSETEKPPTTWNEHILFYVTAFFFLLAIFSLFAFLFLVPFFIEPAIQTLYMDFDLTPATCLTINSNFLRGAQKCNNWSSCKEGCTKEPVECWHIYVQYRSPIPLSYSRSKLPVLQISSRFRYLFQMEQPTEVEPRMNLKAIHYNTQQPDSLSDPLQSVLPEETEEIFTNLTLNWINETELPYFHIARLQPNVKGCGYQDCNLTFARSFGTLGTNFSCYYSLVDPTLAITELDIEKVRSDLVYCLTIPIFSFIISVIYLVYAYFKIYADDPPPDVQSAVDDADPTNDGHVKDALVTSPVSNRSFSGRYGYNFHHHHSPYDNRLKSARVVRRAKSGGAILASGDDRDFYGSRLGANPHNLPPKGMRLSKSMGPRVAENSVIASQRRPACVYPSSPSSSSQSHIPESLSSSSFKTNADSFASSSAEILPNELDDRP